MCESTSIHPEAIVDMEWYGRDSGGMDYCLTNQNTLHEQFSVVCICYTRILFLSARLRGLFILENS